MPSVPEKIARVFVWSFLGIFLPCLVSIAANLSDTVDWSVAKAALVSGIFAAFSAGIRAIIAFLPVLPDDNVGIEKNPGTP